VLELLALPFLACLILTGIHAYLGLHVLARGVIFVDLALAQVAALGLTLALLAGHPLQSDAAWWYALTFAVGGALLFAVTRVRRAPIPQEAIIGIVYAVSAALGVLVVDRAPQGAEHIKQLLVGAILTVTAGDVAALAGLYAVVGLVHWLARRPLLAISLAPESVGARVVVWDALFYVSFAVVVTSSVRLAGVLLVFSFLVVPAAVAALMARGITSRLAIGWAVGVVVSAAGLFASYRWDLPTGATIVAAFGSALALTAIARGAGAAVAAVRRHGARALWPAAIVVAAVIALAGALLVVVPGMDHVWLDALEAVVPRVQEAFLTPSERSVRRSSIDAIARSEAMVEAAGAMHRAAQWGTRPLDDSQRERIAQFLAGRRELAAGDRMVLRTLRAHARQRQRWWLGVPMMVLGLTAAVGIALVRGAPRLSRGAPDVGGCGGPFRGPPRQ
jgi:zinc/manganese transport system permease protein